MKWLLALLLCIPSSALRAEDAAVPAAEAMDPPTAARLKTLADGAATSGWSPVAIAARDASYAAYRAERTNAALAWNLVDRWASLFSENEQPYARRFVAAITQSGVSRVAMSFQPQNRPLAEFADDETRRWLIGNARFSEEFFSILSPLDYLPKVFGALTELRKADPARFAEYASLALAISVVYDLQPPPDWPHGQVAQTALPRKWPDAVTAFSWWVREDRAGHTYQRLARLRADELKFVVDVAAPFSELEWAQRTIGVKPLLELPGAYTMIKYRIDRITANQQVWPGRTYTLAEILMQGGICVDQAYFATNVGKARGVPTLFFRGAGLDGRHAWFGYLDASQNWQMDAGRYAEGRYVTGLVYDPQTFGDLTDHDLKFLTEGFRKLPAYQTSRVHAALAIRLLSDGRADEAAAAARKAANYEGRNLEAWEILIAAQQAQKAQPVVIERTLREAIIAIQKYPDLVVGYTNRLAASLRARGQVSQADEEQAKLARLNQSARSDITFKQVSETLVRSFSQPLAEQNRSFNLIMDNYGRGAGIEFFDQIVVVFAEHLMQLGQTADAQRAVARARELLKIEPGRQLDRELTALSTRVARGR